MFVSPTTKRSKEPKKSRQQEIFKLRAELKQIETKRMIQRINKTKSWFFEKIHKIDKLLAKLTKGPRDSIQINKIRNEKRGITTKTEEIKKKKILRSCYRSLYSTNLESLGKMDDFLVRSHILKLNQDPINYLSRVTSPKKLKKSIKTSQPNKA